MSVGQVVGFAFGGLWLLIGIRAAAGSLREPIAAESVRDRFLVAVHEASKSGFWLSLGAFFVGYELMAEPSGFRWFAFIPLGMAALRLLSAALLSRS